MTSLFDLWIPIIVSSVFVFVVSSIIHMFVNYHKTDYGKIPKEDEAMNALRNAEIPPGDYVIPFAGTTKEMGSEEYIEKCNKGPVVFMTVLKNGPPSMGGSLVMWFISSVIISIFAAYIGSRALGVNPYYLDVFRFVGCSAFMGYSLGHLQYSIWYKKSWCATVKNMLDGLIYALVTAGTFGWLWPK